MQVLRDFCFVGTVFEINVATESYQRFILLRHVLIYQFVLVGGLASNKGTRLGRNFDLPGGLLTPEFNALCVARTFIGE